MFFLIDAVHLPDDGREALDEDVNGFGCVIGPDESETGFFGGGHGASFEVLGRFGVD